MNIIILDSLMKLLPKDAKSEILQKVKSVASCDGFPKGRAPIRIIENQMKTDLRIQNGFLLAVFDFYYPDKKFQKTDPETLEIETDKIPGILACYFYKQPGSVQEIWDTMQPEIEKYRSKTQETEPETEAPADVPAGEPPKPDTLPEAEDAAGVPEKEASEKPAEKPDKKPEEPEKPDPPADPEPEPTVFTSPPVDPDAYNENDCLGYVQLYRTNNGGLYYNYYPIAEIDEDSGLFLPIPDDDRTERFPIYGSVNIYSSNMHSYDPARSFKNGKLVIIGIDEWFLERNYNSQGTLNQTEFKMDLKGLIENHMLHNISDDPYGYYQVFDIPNLSEMISSGKSIMLPPLPNLSAGDSVMLRDQDGWLIGPFPVKEEKQRGATAYSYLVNPEGRKNHYIFDAYDGSWDPTAFLTVSFDALKGEIGAPAKLVCIAKLPKKKKDFASDERLLEELRDLYAKKQDGEIDFYQSSLFGPEIPASVDRSRMERMKAMIRQNISQQERLGIFMDLLAKSLLEIFRTDEAQYKDLIRDLAANSELITGISGSQAFYEAKQEKQKEYDKFVADIEAQKQEKRDEVAAIDKELSEKQAERERLRKEALAKEKEQLDEIRRQSEQIKQEVEQKKEELDKLTDMLGLEKKIEILRYELNKTRHEKESLVKQIDDLTDHFEKVTDETFSRMADIKINERIAQTLASAGSGKPSEIDEHEEMKRSLAGQITLCRENQPEDGELLNRLKDFFRYYREGYEKNEILNMYICFTQGFLTVLSGAPGTGKTTACSLLAHSLGMDRTVDGTNMSRFISVPVERGWSSKRDLIGYYNPLTKEFDKSNQQVYRALEISDLECEIDEERNVPPMAILLDEANLSQMEYYWASFMNAGDRSLGERFVDVGNGKFFRISESLRFLATINNDHTTESLSPRLIDRAWVITLPESTHFKDMEFPEYQLPVSLEQLQRVFGASSTQDADQDMFSRSILNEVYRICHGANMAISQRTRGAIRNYCIAGNRVFIDETGPEFQSGGVIAADFAIAQKILPKIQGQGPAYREKVLDEFKRFFDKYSLTKSAQILDRIIRAGEENMNFYRFFG